MFGRVLEEAWIAWEKVLFKDVITVVLPTNCNSAVIETRSADRQLRPFRQLSENREIVIQVTGFCETKSRNVSPKRMTIRVRQIYFGGGRNERRCQNALLG
jgi:hypothetical protein